MLFTPEELAEMRQADEEIEENFHLTAEDLQLSRDLDAMAKTDRLDNKTRKQRAAQKAYYEANREKVAAGKKSIMKSFRISLGLSQSAFAATLSVSQCAVSQWETGAIPMNLDLLGKIYPDLIKELQNA